MVDYVSDTFPYGTDLIEVSAVRVAFVLYNYTKVTQTILDAKFRKVFAQDPRIHCAFEDVDEDAVLVSIYFPERQYRTKRTKPVYENLAGDARFSHPDALLHRPVSPGYFIDVSEVGTVLRRALWPVIAYQARQKDVSHDEFFKRAKTGPKPWTSKKR